MVVYTFSSCGPVHVGERVRAAVNTSAWDGTQTNRKGLPILANGTH
jgi:hypothetical protein